MGLNAFEYQCGRGVRLGLDKAAKMAALARRRDILFSVHAPYYISMSSLEEDKRLNSIQYLLQSAAVCKALGGRRVIFHSGSCGKQSREAALEKALDTMRRAVEALDEAGFARHDPLPGDHGQGRASWARWTRCWPCAAVDRRITPCIDFGHLNARTLGGIQTKADYAAILDRMARGCWAMSGPSSSTSHFSRIEYSAGGEKRHWTFADTEFGPEPQPLMELLAERKLQPGHSSARAPKAYEKTTGFRGRVPLPADASRKYKSVLNSGLQNFLRYKQDRVDIKKNRPQRKAPLSGSCPAKRLKGL